MWSAGVCQVVLDPEIGAFEYVDAVVRDLEGSALGDMPCTNRSLGSPQYTTTTNLRAAWGSSVFLMTARNL